MKTLVLYFSKTGSNLFLAGKLAAELGADIEAVIPRISLLPVLLMSTWIGIGTGIKKLKSQVENYDAIVFCGPIWIGRFASPLQSALRKHRRSMKKAFFATCCGGGDETKNDKMGYARAFRHIEKLAGGRSAGCEAFPVALVIPADRQNDPDAFMKTRLSEENFQGPVQDRLEEFAGRIRNG